MQSSGDAPKETPLWRFSLSFYEQPDVARACLELQDEISADVNVLLFLLWQATLGRRLSEQELRDIESRIAPWRNAAVMPLRSIRRALKDTPGPPGREVVEALRTKVKSLELEAEQLQQATLYQLAQTFLSRQDRCPAQEAACANVRSYEQLLGTTFPDRTTEILLAALARIARNREE
jgi:uncharacterized protein (TIGR02444 family)